MLLYALVVTFSAVDWVMSMDYTWFSTMWGVYIFAGGAFAAMAFLILALNFLRGIGYLQKVVTGEHYHLMGKLLLTFTIFWAYVTFSQFFLIWYANLPEETIWYKERFEGSWLTISLVLLVGHFVAPFFYLMGRTVKRKGATLAAGGAWLLAMHYLDLYWLVMPVLHPEGFGPSPLDLAAFAAVGGCFVAAAGWLMRRQALVPLRDPRLAESLAFENA
jgi:hypothetical protein